MPKKTTDKHTAAYIPYRCSQSTYEAIEKIAVAQRKTRVQVVRELVEAGLVATGYKQDEEYLAKLIQESLKAVLQPSVERLAAISAKATQISSAAFFMDIFVSRLMLPHGEQDLIDQAAADARKLGIEYLKLKDRDVDSFIADGAGKMTRD